MNDEIKPIQNTDQNHKVCVCVEEHKEWEELMRSHQTS